MYHDSILKLDLRQQIAPQTQQPPQPQPQPQPPTTWAGIQNYTTFRYNTTNNLPYPHRLPQRSTASEDNYTAYKEWCARHHVTNEQYVLKYTNWTQVAGQCVSLEPCLVPYHLAPGIHHFVLWHHPPRGGNDGGTNTTNGSSGHHGHHHDHHDHGGACLPGTTDLVPTQELELVQLLLACDVQESEACVFQQLPEHRSIPSIAHAHVFLRCATPELTEVVEQRHNNWLARSPFMQDKSMKKVNEPHLKEQQRLTEQHSSNQAINDLFVDEYELPWTTTNSLGTRVPLPPHAASDVVQYHERKLYVQLSEQYRLAEFVPQAQAIRYGLSTIVPMGCLHLWTWFDMELNICGTPGFDVQTLQHHTTYKNGLDEHSNIVQWLWEILNEFGDEKQQRFLRFSWGRTRLPLVEQGWTHRFVVSTSHIAKEISQDKFLPEASTCFFQLNLPEYSSKMIMKERLLFAITYCSSIDMDA